jgi:cation:H+ antiporter
MEESFRDLLLEPLGWLWLGLIIVASIALLIWAAEWLVRDAVAISERSGVPKVVIGATVVSLGTTAPEVTVSVMAAVNGHPELAMGNAVGSIICDTGLVLGVACLIRPLPLPRKIVNRQGWVQFAAGLLLILASWPWSNPTSIFSGGMGQLSQIWGFAFLFLLVAYLWISYRWAKELPNGNKLKELETDVSLPMWLILSKLCIAIAAVVFSSAVLIDAVIVVAEHFKISPGIIGGTVVAFGTSLPELITAITAARHGHGDLAVGNVIGADVLNALFVAGAAAAVTSGGLPVTAQFFRWMFPFMFALLFVFRVGIFFSGNELKRSFGIILLGLYVVYLVTLFANILSGTGSTPG